MIQKQPKILIGTPTCYLYEYCLREFAVSVKQLTYPDYDILLADNSPDDEYLKKLKQHGLPATKSPFLKSARARIVAARNVLRQYAIENNYDYFLSLEQDVLPPKDLIEKLLSHKQKIVSGLYYNLNNQYEFPQLKPGTIQLPLAYKLFSKQEESKPAKEQLLRRLTKEEVGEKKRLLLRMSGLGCLLIHKEALKKIEFGYYPDSLASDDRCFSDKALEHKFPIVLDTSAICKHLFQKRPFDWSTIEK